VSRKSYSAAFLTVALALAACGPSASQTPNPAVSGPVPKAPANTDNASQDLNGAARAVLQDYATYRKLPYRNDVYTITSNDGTDATVQVMAEFSANPGQWAPYSAKLFYRKIGGSWKLDRPDPHSAFVATAQLAERTAAVATGTTKSNAMSASTKLECLPAAAQTNSDPLPEVPVIVRNTDTQTHKITVTATLRVYQKGQQYRNGSTPEYSVEAPVELTIPANGNVTAVASFAHPYTFNNAQLTDLVARDQLAAVPGSELGKPDARIVTVDGQDISDRVKKTCTDSALRRNPGT
jgi:hypothetical protein